MSVILRQEAMIRESSLQFCLALTISKWCSVHCWLMHYEMLNFSTLKTLISDHIKPPFRDWRMFGFWGLGKTRAQHCQQLVTMCRKMSELFQRREQQDCHEFLRCVLHYVQEATRMINIQRDVHSDVTRSDGNRSPSTVDAGDGTATGLTSLQSENGCTSESAGSYVHCPLQSTPESCEPHVVDSVFSPLSDVTRVPTVNLQHGCLSDTSCGGHSSPDSPQQAKSAEPGSGCLDNLAPQKSKSSAGKITDYFARSPPAAPRTAADLTVTTRKVADFVEWLCEGKSERITRCLECECTTRCTETFQDVEVVAQKADCRTRTSRSDPHSSDDDTGSEIHHASSCFFLLMFSILHINWDTGISGLMRGMATLPQGNQWLIWVPAGVEPRIAWC